MAVQKPVVSYLADLVLAGIQVCLAIASFIKIISSGGLAEAKL